jgi:hypothetical protein
MALDKVQEGRLPDVRVEAGATIARLTVGDVVVAEYCDGAALPAALAPRPFLHPVTTLSGTPVTDSQPADHRWHLGVSVALQDVGGSNIWGGRTYVRDQGYTWLDDHGRQVHQAWESTSRHGFREDVEWLAADGRRLVSEVRRLHARASDLPGAWVLEIAFTLRNATDSDLTLGSPASNGRAGAGYGGLFWRLPQVGAARVFTPDAEGEEAVHGSLAPWVAFVAPAPRTFTVVLAGMDDASRRDPWFVRVSDYPGVGSQLVADEPVVLARGTGTTRIFRALIADSALHDDEIRRGLGDGTR